MKNVFIFSLVAMIFFGGCDGVPKSTVTNKTDNHYNVGLEEVKSGINYFTAAGTVAFVALGILGGVELFGKVGRSVLDMWKKYVTFRKDVDGFAGWKNPDNVKHAEIIEKLNLIAENCAKLRS